MSKAKSGFLIPERFKPVLGAFIFFVLMMVIFIAAAPEVFLTVGIYTAIFLSLPLFAIMGLSLVFVTAAGEIDLSFPSIIPLSGLAFAWTLQQTNFNFALAALFCIVVGLACGLQFERCSKIKSEHERFITHSRATWKPPSWFDP